MTITASSSAPSGWTRDADGLLRIERATIWRDELVELVVLAEHGDDAAGRRLADWLAADTTVQAVFTAIARDVTAVRAVLETDPPAPGARRPG
ncbi:MAG TPA: hypothetical protein VGH76_03380 [Actinomycetospora sp.]|uniref:hypothetical protein n=1 Tax=Actinomycetospora sp. TaxID=1872135 RepID=UPI002F3F9EED